MNDPLRGTACYTADIPAGDALHVVFVRSDVAHGELGPLDTGDALAVPGVRYVLGAGDLDVPGDFPAFLRQPTVDGRPLAVPRRPVLAERRVRHVGEPIAMVIADSRAAALDGAEALIPEITELPAVVGTDAPRDDIHAEAPGNIAARVDLGDSAAVSAALDGAARVVSATVQTPRMAAAPMEPLTAIAAHDAATGMFDLWTPHQGIAEQRRDISAVLQVPADQIRVHADRVGGAFGARGAAFPETVALLAAARLTGQRLRWEGTRSEMFLAEYHGRGLHLTGHLSLNEHHRFTGLHVRIRADLGAYVHPVGAHISVGNTLMGVTGCYRIPAARMQAELRFTNAVPVGPFRGAGRPDIALLIERLVDEAAAETGLDPLELRRINAVPPEAFPYLTPLGARYDSGDYPGMLDLARKAADWDGFAERERADLEHGLQRGIGASLFVEVAGGGTTPEDTARLDVDLRGGRAHIAIATVTQSTGQDHDGLFRGLVARRLGLDANRLSLAQSSLRDTPSGSGSYGSRSTIHAGSAIDAACTALIRHLAEAEAAVRGCAPGDLTLAPDGAGTGGDNNLWSLPDALDRAAREGAFSVGGSAPVVQTFPAGCHIAEVQLDPETGTLRVLRYLAVDDAGRVMSQAGVEGQVRGGVVQGLSGALLEALVHDANGQLLTASLMDYALPRADMIPAIRVLTANSPSPTNRLGVKGVGEAGTTGALAAVTNAVADALRRRGARLPPFPLSPVSLWQSLNSASATSSAGGESGAPRH